MTRKLPEAQPRPKRPKKAALTPLEWMLQILNDEKASDARRDRMAIAASQYLHRRMHDGGIKEARATAAKKAANSGRFKRAATPKGLLRDE